MSKQREAMKQALHALQTKGEHHRFVYDAMKALAEALAEPEQKLDSALEALQNKMRETISKLDPNEMVWIHQPPGMPPILCKEPVVGAVPVCATASARKPVGTVTGWYGGYPVIEPVDGWIPAVGTVLYSAPLTRKPLTDEDISAIVQSMSAHTWDAHMLARLIEKAHGIGE